MVARPGSWWALVRTAERVVTVPAVTNRSRSSAAFRLRRPTGAALTTGTGAGATISGAAVAAWPFAGDDAAAGGPLNRPMPSSGGFPAIDAYDQGANPWKKLVHRYGPQTWKKMYIRKPTVPMMTAPSHVTS